MNSILEKTFNLLNNINFWGLLGNEFHLTKWLLSKDKKFSLTQERSNLKIILFYIE